MIYKKIWSTSINAISRIPYYYRSYRIRKNNKKTEKREKNKSHWKMKSKTNWFKCKLVTRHSEGAKRLKNPLTIKWISPLRSKWHYSRHFEWVQRTRNPSHHTLGFSPPVEMALLPSFRRNETTEKSTPHTLDFSLRSKWHHNHLSLQTYTWPHKNCESYSLVD